MIPDLDIDKNSIYEGLEVRTICILIYAMNVASRNLLSYPRGHPLVLESFQKVEDILNGLFESRNDLMFGIAKDAFMLGEKFLGRKDPILRIVARTLFKHGIIGLKLLKGVSVHELIEFDAIILQKYGEIRQQGGIVALLSKARIKHIQVQLINYSMFQAAEGASTCNNDDRYPESSLFWWRLVRGLLKESLNFQDGSSEPWEDIDPEALAAALNGACPDPQSPPGEGPDFAVLLAMKKSHFKQLAQDQDSTTRLARFLKSLSRDLRQRFMDRFFTSLLEHSDVADDVLSGFPDEIILEALENHTTGRHYIPPSIVDILHKLRKGSKSGAPQGGKDSLADYSREELVEKFKIILREDEGDRFIPLDYQKLLRGIIAAETLSAPDLVQVQELKKTLTDQSTSVTLASVIAHMIASRGCDQVSDDLKLKLRDSCIGLIRSGDFQIVIDILETMQKNAAPASNGHERVSTAYGEIFSGKEFIEEVLNASVRWGKEKHFLIAEIIRHIGSSFAEPLLDHLAEEGNRMLRQFYMDLLLEMGEAARDPAIRRLQDSRWYVVRNLVIILRNLNDASALSSIRCIVDYPHPKVRQEVLQTLLKLNDPMADRLLLEELNSSDSGRIVKAIMMAGKSRNRDIFLKLVGFLKRRWLANSSFEIKKASIHALAEMGNSAALPVLRALLISHSVFFPGKSRLLKLEIIASLAKYPAAEASGLLRDMVKSRSHALVKQAALVMKDLDIRGV